MQSITTKRISTGTVFRILLTGLISGLVPIFLVLGILASFGLVSLTWQDKAVHGMGAIWLAPIMGLFLAFGFSAILGCAAAFGLWLYSKVGTLRIDYEPSED